MRIWLNGEFVERDHAKLSAFDAAFQHGVGLFETMRAYNGRVYRLEQHLERLATSAQSLRLTDHLNVEPLADAVRMTVEQSELTDARVRLTITGGDLNLLQSQRRAPVAPDLLIVAQPATMYPDEFYERGVQCTIADDRLNPWNSFAGHKTINYWRRLAALQAAATVQASESLWMTVTNHFAGGSVSNMFIVRDGQLVTPFARDEVGEDSIPSPVLPGITRAAIRELAATEQVETLLEMIDVSAVLSADEMFLTNSSWGVLPVVAIVHEGTQRPLGRDPGQVGQLTRHLRQCWLDDVARRTSS